jgi:hypothetical protein
MLALVAVIEVVEPEGDLDLEVDGLADLEVAPGARPVAEGDVGQRRRVGRPGRLDAREGVADLGVELGASTTSLATQVRGVVFSPKAVPSQTLSVVVDPSTP